MYAQERKIKILEHLNKRKLASVDELARLLYVSPATIRRDLSAMSAEGLIRRSHGGAVLYGSGAEETSSLIREQENVKEKKLIAQLAADFVSNSTTLFMDSSSTAGAVIPFISDRKYLTIITNGLKNALALSHLDTIRTYVAGGVIQPQTHSAVGSDTCAFFSGLNAQVAMTSCSGISLEQGITDASYEQSRIKQIMLDNAKVKVLLCDHTKFGQIFLCKTSTWKDLDYIVTDCKPPEAYINAAVEQGCEFLYPDIE